MYLRNILYWLLILIYCFDHVTQKSSKVLKFKSIKCSSSNKTLAPDYKCFIKAYSRRNTTINMSGTIMSPIYDAKGHLLLTYEYMKKGNPRTMINATADVCSFLNGTKSDVLMKWVIGIIGHYMPAGLVHSCPYVSYLTCYGLSIVGDTANFWPDGLYTFDLRLFNQMDPNLYSVKIEIQVSGTAHADTRFR